MGLLIGGIYYGVGTGNLKNP